MNCKTKSFMTKKKAFTLIELLIVIAIIGILFIVLVSKVDFATDKAKATGVQTDFRSFQLAFDTVAKENAGFNTFGWDTGDLNQDGIRNSYDEGDNGAGGGTAKNGIQDGTEVFTGHKVYAETFNKVFSLKKAKSDGTLETNYDRDALNRLEAAINANLDPKLHITIKDDGEIVMANGAQDPWNNEYHGWYITNAETDKKDRGAIIMYSDGANGEFGSEHTIANGVVSVNVPGSNKAGKDDYSLVSCYTYVNGYGEVKNATTGFSNNQTFLGGNSSVSGENDNLDSGIVSLPNENPSATNLNGYTWMEIKALAQAKLSKEDYKNKYGIEPGSTKTDNGITYVLVDLGLEAGDYNGFVFMYQAIKSRMTDDATNFTGYPDAKLVTNYLSDVEASLTGSDLGNAMKSVDVTCSHSYVYPDSYPTSIYTTKMFLPSIKELGVDNITFASSHEQEGQTFDLFVDGASARLTFQNLIGLTFPWWTRSSANGVGFYLINNSFATAAAASGISAELTVVPCFVVG